MKRRLFLLFWLFPVCSVLGGVLGVPWLTWFGVGVGLVLVLLLLLSIVTGRHIVPTDDEIFREVDK
jgi:uncharacterized protein (DUF58 family)